MADEEIKVGFEMTINSKRTLSCGAVFIASAVALSGCTGTSTYGTGKSQERQLFDDITGIVALGGGNKKERIDYSSRSGLVKPPSRTELPAPAEKIQGGDGYFPEDAETKRQRLLAAVDEAEANGTELPPEVAAARRESAAAQRPNVGKQHEDRDLPYDPTKERIERAEFLKRKAELQGAQGAAPRKYLTEPKKIYRTPADTAQAGVVGEEAKNPNREIRKKKSLWDRIRGN